MKVKTIPPAPTRPDVHITLTAVEVDKLKLNLADMFNGFPSGYNTLVELYDRLRALNC